MNMCNVCVFDFETGSVDINKCEVLEVACQVYDARKLELIPGSEFTSLIKPLDFGNVQSAALAVNKITKAELEEAPELSVVWPQFCAHIQKYNTAGKGFMTAPIPAGYNSRNFDYPIFSRVCQKFGFCDKSGKQNIFHSRFHLDVLDIIFMYFENSNDLPNYKFDSVRPYFGLEGGDKAHSALFDVEQTGEILMRFLKLQRSLKIRFKDSMRIKV